MMRQYYAVLTVCLAVCLYIIPGAAASEHGCKVLLCLASPEGPMEHEECRPAIKKLYRDLFNWKPFPSCAMSGGGGINVEHGKRRYFECKEYGDGWESFKRNSGTACRKLVGAKKVKVCGQHYGGYGPKCRFVKKKQYAYKELRKRSEPYYVQVKQNGQNMGEAFYYSKKAKRKKRFW